MPEFMTEFLLKMERTETMVLTEQREMTGLMTKMLILRENMELTELMTKMMVKTEHIKTPEVMTLLPVKMKWTHRWCSSRWRGQRRWSCRSRWR